MKTTEQSTIRQLLREVANTGESHPIFKEMRAKLGREVIVKGKGPTVAIVDWHEMAVVILGPDTDEEPVGMLTIDWSEPCLEFKPLKDA